MLIEDMTVKECLRAIEKVGFGRLACARDNQPYVTPVHFVVDGEEVYAFSMPGQKVEWMRSNPSICLEVDDVTSRSEWTSVIAFGRYEELPLDWPSRRERAQQLLQREAFWWQPGAIPAEGRPIDRDAQPIFFRIQIDRLTGRRGVPMRDEELGGHG